MMMTRSRPIPPPIYMCHPLPRRRCLQTFGTGKNAERQSACASISSTLGRFVLTGGAVPHRVAPVSSSENGACPGCAHTSKHGPTRGFRSGYIVGQMDPDDASPDTAADPVDTSAHDPVIFSDDVVQAVPFPQTNIG